MIYCCPGEALPGVSRALNRTHASTVRFVGLSTGESGTCTYAVVPLNESAFPTRPPLTTAAPPSRTPWFVPATSAPPVSAGHHAANPETAGLQSAPRPPHRLPSKSSPAKAPLLGTVSRNTCKQCHCIITLLLGVLAAINRRSQQPAKTAAMRRRCRVTMDQKRFRTTLQHASVVRQTTWEYRGPRGARIANSRKLRMVAGLAGLPLEQPRACVRSRPRQRACGPIPPPVLDPPKDFLHPSADSGPPCCWQATDFLIR